MITSEIVDHLLILTVSYFIDSYELNFKDFHHLQKLDLTELQAYSHHMRLRFTAQIGQSLKNTASSWS